MDKIKYFFMKNNMIIVIALIVVICAIAIAVGVYAQITNKKLIVNKDETNEEYAELEKDFDQIFTNSINKETTAKQDIDYNEIIYCAYNIEKTEAKYSVNAKVPLFKIKNEATEKVNQEIYNTFVKTITDIAKNSTTHTTFDLSYVVYVNNNIVSLVIKCTYKNGSNPQRKIIQTYNYDTENNKILDIDQILKYKNLEKQDVEKAIKEKIAEEKKEDEVYYEQGYSAFVRNENDNMYKIENTPNFFIGKENHLYLVYAYGNNNYTSEIDLVIF